MRDMEDRSGPGEWGVEGTRNMRTCGWETGEVDRLFGMRFGSEVGHMASGREKAELRQGLT